MDIQRGERIVVRDATGEWLPRRALRSEPGDTFAVVWACRETEWEAAESEQREPDGVPWPAEDVSRADEYVAR